jgi:hypothetical protein
VGSITTGTGNTKNMMHQFGELQVTPAAIAGSSGIALAQGWRTWRGWRA